MGSRNRTEGGRECQEGEGRVGWARGDVRRCEVQWGEAVRRSAARPDEERGGEVRGGEVR